MNDSRQKPLALLGIGILSFAAVLQLTLGLVRPRENGAASGVRYGDRGGVDYTPPDSATELAHRRSRRKNDLAVEVLRGQRSFRQAAAEFRQLHPDQESRTLLVQVGHPGATEEEAFARNLIAFMRAAARGDPEQLSLVDRLEAAVQHAVDRGTLSLSD
jgi:hypothetical protein